MATDIARPPAGTAAVDQDARARPKAERLKAPALIFLILSLLFGTATVALTPPFRGHDEPAHFLRAYAMAGGEFAPLADAQGHKGTFVSPALAAAFDYFVSARYQPEPHDHRPVMRGYFDLPAAAKDANAGARVFVIYEGSEGYSPAAYLPYIAAAAVGRLLGLGFLPLLYLMRLAGLVATTALAAYAIAVIPFLRWPLLMIAMLPASLYARSIISADGPVLSYSLAVLALALNAAVAKAAGAGARSLWMTLCVLAKPPQIAFLLLEAVTAPLRELPARWRTIALVALPGVILSAGWVVLVSADAGQWRMIEGSHLPAEQFSPLWKLGFMLAHPLRFPAMLLASLTDDPLRFWRQVIGVLGWLDDPLRPGAYALLTLVLALVMFDRVEAPKALRMRIAVVSGLTALAYTLAVYLIFFLVWTRITLDKIDGVQGRYFEVCLPLVALALSACFDFRLTGRALRALAVFGALACGLATVEAILRNCWLIALPF